MTSRQNRPPDESYHELAIAGSFSPKTVETLFLTALGVSLGIENPDNNHVFTSLPISGLRMYDLHWIDTGQRTVTRHEYDDPFPIYKLAPRELTRRPIETARFALRAVTLENVGAARQNGVEAKIEGCLEVNLDEAPLRSSAVLSSVRNVLAKQVWTFGENEYSTTILGKLVAGQDFSFGNRSYEKGDSADVYLGTYDDHRRSL